MGEKSINFKKKKIGKKTENEEKIEEIKKIGGTIRKTREKFE